MKFLVSITLWNVNKWLQGRCLLISPEPLSLTSSACLPFKYPLTQVPESVAQKALTCTNRKIFMENYLLTPDLILFKGKIKMG